MNRYFLTVAIMVLCAANFSPDLCGAPLDMNGDGMTDFVIVRQTGSANNRQSKAGQNEAIPDGGAGQKYWWISLNGSGAMSVIPWGLAQDWDVPEDFDGDGKTDAAVWRPGPAGEAAFYVFQSSNNTMKTELFGQSGDAPTTVADYDGDGKADFSVYRCPNANNGQCTWFYRGTLNNPSGGITYVSWGFGHFGLLRNIRAVPGDYDGDQKADFCVHTDAGGGRGRFWLLKSSGGFEAIDWGFDPFNDISVPGDFDGDGKNDFAVVRPEGLNWSWYILERDGGGTGSNPIVWGLTADDDFVPGDYDGDGKTDIAVWRSANDDDCNFFVRRSSDRSMFVKEWGQTGDFPAATWQID